MLGVLAALWPEGADASSPGTLEPTAASRPLLVPPSGRVVHGMGQWEQYNVRLLARLPDAVRPAAQLLFVDIGDTPRGWRPQGVSARLEALGRDGFIPVLDIGLRGQDFAQAFTAAFGCTAEQFEQDPEKRQRLHEASPLFLVTADDPQAFVMGAWGEDLAVLRDPPVPAVINDPHSVWHGVLLAEAMRKVNVPVVVRLGPDCGYDCHRQFPSGTNRQPHPAPWSLTGR